ncbi:hypothetical protein RRG08_065773 [Elysia crispata]|nr:hypothetical protein RRG08_065773 [Elysia crispata]
MKVLVLLLIGILAVNAQVKNCGNGASDFIKDLRFPVTNRQADLIKDLGPPVSKRQVTNCGLVPPDLIKDLGPPVSKRQV